MYTISICIPTYNGQDILGETLDSIIKEIQDYNVEIVINDDKSTDNTLTIAKEYAKKYPYISVYQNEKNLRMDRNFTATALKAKGKYVWFCGQDDILQNGIIKKAFDIIDNMDINFIYFNYKFVDDSLVNELMTPPLNIDKDRYFDSMEDYFQVINHAPSFLPANLMKKEFWDTSNYEQYYDTYYVQTGVWLENFYKGKIFVVSDSSYVLCRVPLESWKNDDGKMIFETATGDLKTYKIALNNKKIPKDIYRNKESYYIKHFLLLIIATKSKGLEIRSKIKEDLAFIFEEHKLPLIYMKFLLYMPVFIAKIAYIIGRTFRGFVRKFL